MSNFVIKAAINEASGSVLSKKSAFTMVHKLPNDENIDRTGGRKEMGPSKQKMLSTYNIRIVCELKKYLNTLFSDRVDNGQTYTLKVDGLTFDSYELEIREK